MNTVIPEVLIFFVLPNDMVFCRVRLVNFVPTSMSFSRGT